MSGKPNIGRIETLIEDLKDRVAAESWVEADAAAFDLAKNVAQFVNRPVAVQVMGGPRGAHMIEYRIIPLDWHSWSHETPIESRTVHIVRTYLDPRGERVDSAQKIIGSRRQDAKPAPIEDVGVDLKPTDAHELTQFAREAPAMWIEFQRLSRD